MRILIIFMLLQLVSANEEISQPVLLIINLALTISLFGVYGYKLFDMYRKRDATP